MNWSDYSRFVGDVFGAPLAIEGLIAFFLEATFIGLWIFGWDRLPKLAHLISIWMVAIATNLSAFFILAANSWMQHPVGFRINPERGRAELTSLWAVLNNSTNQVAYPHVATASFLTAAAFVIGVPVRRDGCRRLSGVSHRLVSRHTCRAGCASRTGCATARSACDSGKEL
jgi:cytochrome bd ubiquinol oxidase subunit I